MATSTENSAASELFRQAAAEVEVVADPVKAAASESAISGGSLGRSVDNFVTDSARQTRLISGELLDLAARASNPETPET